LVPTCLSDRFPPFDPELSRPGELFHTLAKLVSYRTIADSEHREECRQGALYLKRVLREMGAETNLVSWHRLSPFLSAAEVDQVITPLQLPGAPGKNPVVLATFRANAPPKPATTPRRKRVLYYGHYDVVSATASERWDHDPWKMSGQNGWLYGRGVTDNKGPILAIAAAASGLRRRQELEVDLVMAIEGEEETGSAGFQEAIKRNRVGFGSVGHSQMSQCANGFRRDRTLSATSTSSSSATRTGSAKTGPA
jgi:di- and tripeptidase